MPDTIAVNAVTIRYIAAVVLPIIFHMVVIVAALVAGPAIRNTRAAPGDIPVAISAAATGTEAVAQT